MATERKRSWVKMPLNQGDGRVRNRTVERGAFHSGKLKTLDKRNQQGLLHFGASAAHSFELRLHLLQAVLREVCCLGMGASGEQVGTLASMSIGEFGREP